MKLSAADFVRMSDAQPRAGMEAGVHSAKCPRLKQGFREGQAFLAEAEAYWAIVRDEAAVHSIG